MDISVALVQAYLHVNGYLTVTEYPVASVLLRGHLKIEDIQPPAIFDPAVKPMIERIEMVVDRSLNTKLSPVTDLKFEVVERLVFDGLLALQSHRLAL